jgi:hypothetical protein
MSPRLVLLGVVTVELTIPLKLSVTPFAPPNMMGVPKAPPLKRAVVLNVTVSAFAAPAVTPTIIATANTAKDMLKNFLIVCSFFQLLVKTPPEVLLTWLILSPSVGRTFFNQSPWGQHHEVLEKIIFEGRLRKLNLGANFPGRYIAIAARTLSLRLTWTRATPDEFAPADALLMIYITLSGFTASSAVGTLLLRQIPFIEQPGVF